MPFALAFNPGSASLKFEVIEVDPCQAAAGEARKVAAASIEEIGNHARLLIFEGRGIARTESCEIPDMHSGAAFALRWLRDRSPAAPHMDDLVLAGVRVVHGGSKYTEAVPLTAKVKADIEALEELAPLHNKSSLAIFDVLHRELARVPAFAAFDTAFHLTMPEVAWRYPIPRRIADELGVRKFGFHGLSHRSMVEQYAKAAGKPPEDCILVTLHLESGCSAAAIRRGRSIDTTMGLTPLEGLMMGTRSGSVDPALVPHLMRKLEKSADEVIKLLNHESGLLGIAGQSFDTRELAKRSDPAAKLALEMFAYRIRLAVGAYLAVLENAEAVIFGGGIGEDTPSIRAMVCRGLENFGLEFDEEANARSTSGPALLTRPGSRLQARVIPAEEGLQIAHECFLALKANDAAAVSEPARRAA
ncbi:MAG: acetate/propionate family kinase [Acidobacteriaceae bacterium]